MKAVQIHRYGDVDTLAFEEVSEPVPGRSEVLIRVHAAGVNPADWKSRQGALASVWEPYAFPIILGWDISGEIVALGSDVSNFVLGDAVYGMLRFPLPGNAYAEYTTAPVSDIALKPRSLDHLHAAAISLAALTAWQALFEAAHLQAGQTVLIHAAAGGVGHLAVQLAKWKGAHVIGAASERNAAFLRSLGVDTVIDDRQQQLETVVHDVDVVLDTLVASHLEPSLRVLKRGGFLVSIVRRLDTSMEQTRDIQTATVSVRPQAAQLTEITHLIDTGALTIHLNTIFPLQEAHLAHQLSETGRVCGKLVLDVRASV